MGLRTSAFVPQAHLKDNAEKLEEGLVGCTVINRVHRHCWIRCLVFPLEEAHFESLITLPSGDVAAFVHVRFF